MKSRTAPKPGATGFAMSVTPCQECLNKAVAEGAFCRPDKCWHKLEIASTLAAAGRGRTAVKEWRLGSGAAGGLLHKSSKVFDKRSDAPAAFPQRLSGSDRGGRQCARR
jgi:hypothetical protein